MFFRLHPVYGDIGRALKIKAVPSSFFVRFRRRDPLFICYIFLLGRCKPSPQVRFTVASLALSKDLDSLYLNFRAELVILLLLLISSGRLELHSGRPHFWSSRGWGRRLFFRVVVSFFLLLFLFYEERAAWER